MSLVQGIFSRGLLVLTAFLAFLLLSIAAHAQIVANQDQLLEGSITLTSYSAINSLIPLPVFTNQKFCSLVTLAPNTLVWAYVPSRAERIGDFSAFPRPLIDPLTNAPFPNNIIPANRLLGDFAWRLAPSGPAAGEPCLNFPSAVSFTTANYITGRTAGDALFTTPQQIVLNYTLGGTPPTASFNVNSFSLSQLPFALLVSPGAGPASTVPHLLFTPTLCCVTPGFTSPSGVTVTLSSSQILPPGLYVLPINVTPINTIGGAAIVNAALTVAAPPTWLTTDKNVVSFPSYTLGTSAFPPAEIVRITSLGAGTNFSITQQSTTPPGVNWFTVTPTSGAGPQPLTVSLNTAVLNRLGRGQFTGYFDIFSSRTPGSGPTPGQFGQPSLPQNGAAPNSPVRVLVFATVFPNPDFTIDPTTLNFVYVPGGPTPATATFSLDKVSNPLGNDNGLMFSPGVTLANPRDPMFIKAAPSASALPGTFNVSVDSTALGQLNTGDHIAYLDMNAPTGPNDGQDPPNSYTAGRVSVTLSVSNQPLNTNITQVLAQIADGGGWQTRIVLVNTDTVNAAPFTLRFWPGQDTPLTLAPVLSTGALTTFTLSDTIPKGGSRTILTQGSASPPLWQGWVELTAPPSVGGTAVFHHSSGSNQDNEGAVPLKSPDGNLFILPFDCTSPDSTHTFGTSMAIINADSAQTANVTVTAYDENANPIALPASASNFSLEARRHQAFSLTDKFSALAGKRGTVVFTTTAGQLAGLGLRFSSRQAFTSMQTLTGVTGATSKRIAQIADGGGWKTTIVVVNLDSVPAGVTIRFNRSALTPTATLALQDPGLVGSVYTTQTSIPANGSLWISTQGTSSTLWEGWATVTSNANIDGFAIFRNQFSDTADSEGAVPFSSPGGTRFLLPFDNTSGFVTSMALVSPDSSGAMITGTFRSPDGTPVNPFMNSLSLTGHTAFRLIDPPFTVSGSGVGDFSTTGTEVFGIGLLFNPRNSFTSLPILKR
jgi:hypothetical protein